MKGSKEGGRVVAELPLNSMIRLTSLKTMKPRGEIKGDGVVVMIDPVATHNFISVDLVWRWGLEVDKAE